MKFSVLMSIYKKEEPKYFVEALESVLNQTVMPNEIVIIEDGILTKELQYVIIKYKEKYPDIIKNYPLKENKGLGLALNYGATKCKHNLIARMDTDDIALPTRFEKQLEIFEKNPSYDIVGGNILEFAEGTNITNTRIVPEKKEEIYKYAKKRNPMNHVTVMFKKDAILEVGNYENLPYFEDYYLWCKLIKMNKNMYNIQDILCKVRAGEQMAKRRGGRNYIKAIYKFQKKIEELGIINQLEKNVNTLIRSAVSIAPNNLRSLTYSKLLRGRK